MVVVVIQERQDLSVMNYLGDRSMDIGKAMCAIRDGQVVMYHRDEYIDIFMRVLDNTVLVGVRRADYDKPHWRTCGLEMEDLLATNWEIAREIE